MAPREVLPGNVKPVHYKLTVTPDLVGFTFAGTVDVKLSVVAETTSISFNTHEITITSATISNVTVSGWATDAEAQTSTVSLASAIAAGETIVLTLGFTGILNDALAGFYRSKYTTASGETKYLGCTQFEPADARRAFPCWDEPALKATFDIVLRVPKALVALSNMPVTSDVPVADTDLKEVSFATTPIMSTYLIAYVVGEFDYAEARSPEGVLIRTYTPPGLKHEGDYSVSVATKALSFLGKFFDAPYPLPKLDMVAIPDFAAGAMENWGLVTYRTSVILFNESRTSAALKQRICYIIAHELSHQWFGNLVTMGWWDNLWLNEGASMLRHHTLPNS